MTNRSRNVRILLTTLAAGLCLALASEPARGESTQAVRPRSARRSSASHATQKSSAGHRTTRHARGRARRSPSLRQRLAHLRPEPQRVEEIQQALIKAGDLRGSPTGKWDDATKQAMARYQSEYGFPVTGQPDAKSLMKLGLGPHPLPAELDRASVNPPAKPASSVAQPAQHKSDPPENR